MRMRFGGSGKPDGDSIQLLASILVYYPEIGMVDYEPKTDCMQFSFALKEIPAREEFEQQKDFIGESLLAYHSLEGFFDAQITISLEGQDGTAFLRVTRDVATLSRGEIDLLAALVREKFAQTLLKEDEPEPMIYRAMEDYAAGNEGYPNLPDDNIDHMIGSLKIHRLPEHVVGIREQGRVMVYHK